MSRARAFLTVVSVSTGSVLLASATGCPTAANEVGEGSGDASRDETPLDSGPCPSDGVVLGSCSVEGAECQDEGICHVRARCEHGQFVFLSEACEGGAAMDARATADADLDGPVLEAGDALTDGDAD